MGVQEWLTVREFLERHKEKINRNGLYRNIRDHTIPSIELGRKILLTADCFERLLAAGSDSSKK